MVPFWPTAYIPSPHYLGLRPYNCVGFCMFVNAIHVSSHVHHLKSAVNPLNCEHITAKLRHLLCSAVIVKFQQGVRVLALNIWPQAVLGRKCPCKMGIKKYFCCFFFRKLHRVSENCAIIHSYITLTDGNRFSKFFFS